MELGAVGMDEIGWELKIERMLGLGEIWKRWLTEAWTNNGPEVRNSWEWRGHLDYDIWGKPDGD